MRPKKGLTERAPGGGWGRPDTVLRRTEGQRFLTSAALSALSVPLFALPAAAATATATTSMPPDIVIAALVGGACALGLAGAFWAFAESRGSARLRRTLRKPSP